MELNLCRLNGDQAGKLEVSEKVFGVKPKPEVIQQAVAWFQAARRAGTHSTLTRSQVSGGGKKPWKQKGTGRARVGSIRSPLWRKGGVVFGPKPRDYGYSLPKKIRKTALCMALSDRAAEGKIIVVENWSGTQSKTREAVKVLKALKAENKCLLILNQKDEIFFRAARNLSRAEVVFENDVNIHNLLNAAQLIMSAETVKELEKKLS